MTSLQFNFPVEHIRLVLINGIFDETASQQNLLPDSIKIKIHPNQDFELIVAKNNSVQIPIYLVHIYNKSNNKIFNQKITLAENSNLNLIEHRIGEEVSIELMVKSEVNFDLASNAKLTYLKYQNLPNMISATTDFVVSQQNNSVFASGFFSTGGHVTQDNLQVKQLGLHAESNLFGLALPNQNGQIIAQHIQVDHQASHGASRMLYKGILDKKSSSKFNGKVVVHKNIEKINAFQANHHLLLSTNASAKSQPELEIDSEDVKCAHGSTVGQLDQEALFYLRARGIPEVEAKKLLTDAFAAEIFAQISEIKVQDWLSRQVQDYA